MTAAPRKVSASNIAGSEVAASEPGELYAGGEGSAVDRAAEVTHARRLAERYRLAFVDMDEFRIDAELFRSIPADLMLRYGFVPHRKDGETLIIVVSDPTDLPMIDELALLLDTAIQVTVGTSSAIESILKKSEGSQRVLDEATESFELQILHDEEGSEESLTVERLTSDISPVIRLVDSMIYTALQRRASDIHIETQDDAVHVKYRIDGTLQSAMRPVDKRFHSAILSRVKVMAELDIAEKRVPQDGCLAGSVEQGSISYWFGPCLASVLADGIVAAMGFLLGPLVARVQTQPAVGELHDLRFGALAINSASGVPGLPVVVTVDDHGSAL